MKLIHWRQTAMRYGAPVETAFVGEIPVASIGRAHDPGSYTWKVCLPAKLPTEKYPMTGSQLTETMAKLVARKMIQSWFEETE